MDRRALILMLSSVVLVAAVTEIPHVSKQVVVDQSVFPAPGARPPLPSFRAVSTAQQAACAPAGGGWRMAVRHADLKGVTPEMMRWLFANLANGTAKSPASPNGRSYPLFLLMHPRDHVRHTVVGGGPVKVGSQLNWIEFPLTGCTPAGDSYSCPSAPAQNPGFTTASPAKEWAKLDQVNGTSTLRKLTKSGVRFSVRGCNEAGACAWVITTQHAWKPNKATGGLSVTTALKVGIGFAGVDERITKAWANGVEPAHKCQRALQHAIEEIGNLEAWLPAAYAASGAAAADAAAAKAEELKAASVKADKQPAAEKKPSGEKKPAEKKPIVEEAPKHDKAPKPAPVAADDVPAPAPKKERPARNVALPKSAEEKPLPKQLAVDHDLRGDSRGGF